MQPITDVSRRRFLEAATGAAFTGSLCRLSGEEPGRLPDTDEWIRQQAAKAPLSLKFPGGTKKECQAWQEKFSGKLKSLLGPHSPPAKWKTVVRQAIDLEDHRREDLLLQAKGHPPLPIYLLLPRGKSSKARAGVLALHGHGPSGYHPVAGRDDLKGVAGQIKSSNYDYGRQLVRRGYVVAVPCLSPFGPRLGKREATGKQDPCAVTFIRLQMLGKVRMAENLRDCLWSVELLARHPLVDAKRLGCVGLSYGGRMTMLTAALEPRIKVAGISGALNVMQERIAQPYSCGAQVIPGLLQYGDVPEIASLIAPRAAVWEVGSRDGLIKEKWADDALARMRLAYKALDAKDNLIVDRFDGGHAWHGTVAYRQLEKVLG
jgi:dienelactone hydrolase